MLTTMKTEIVSTEVIRPSSPTPAQLREFKLSFIDERIPPSYFPLILYYNCNEDRDVSRPEMSHRLKNSLSDALVSFYPLAGRMKGQTLVDCNDQGILYVEANADGKISEIVKSPDSQVLDRLIPFKSNGLHSTAEEQLAVQTTFFNCGGFAVGICISHRIGDFSTLSSFIKFWAAKACLDQTNAISPVFNAAALFPPRNTPDFKPNSQSPSVNPKITNVLLKRFVFTSSAIESLKSQVTEKSRIINPTRVETVSAILWSRCTAAKRLKITEKSVLYHPVNLRGRIPALPEHSFGNLFQMTRAESVGKTNWVCLVEKIRAAFGKIDGHYMEKLLGENGFEVARENFLEISKLLALGDVEVLRFSNIFRFPIYEADFGWGKPVWVSIGNYQIKNSVFLLDSVDSPGGVEAWIVLDRQEMERLQQDVHLQRLRCKL